MLFLSHFRRSILFTILAAAAQSSASAQCHSPDGTISPLDQPCYPSASESFCCPPSSICSGNKLCILPGGQALRGSCTDPSFSSVACPNFCLHKGAGLRHSAGLNMTLCQTEPDSTTYCCNEGSGEACDCSAKNSRKITLHLFNPVTTISPVDRSIPSASLIKAKVSSGAAAASTSTRFLQRPVHQVERWFIPWKTLGPILLAILVVLFFALVLFLIRRACLTGRRREATRASVVMEVGRGRRYSDWAVYWDDKDVKSKSNFSIGSVDSEVSSSDNGKALTTSKDVGNALNVSILSSPNGDGLRRCKLDELKKTSLEVHLEDLLHEAYLGRQRCDSVVSQPVLDTTRAEEQGGEQD
jgi:hypothetical protein